MWWVVLVLLSCQDRELAVGAGVGPSRGRRSEESGGPPGAEPLTRADQAERRGFGDPPEAARRAKRGFTYPGTLWCGAGNMADHYDQLGEYEETDGCCRTHDHCPHVIHAFSSKYGHTNFKWHSISHCDCDEALKVCLRRVNDTSSRVVGQAFFNVIGAPCFELVHEERCAERRWYGPCKRYDELPVAVVKEAVPYDYGGIAVIDVLTRAPPERKETPTQAALSGPEGPSLGNTGATPPAAAEDFVKVLATVSAASAADSDKESQSSDGKRTKKKGGAEKKTKKRNGQKRRQKVVGVEGGATVFASGGKKAVEKVPWRNSIGHQTASQRLRDAQSARSSNDVLKDEAPAGTGELPGTAGPSSAPPKKAPLAAPKEIPQLTNNLTAPLMSQPEQRPGEEISPPGVKSADVSGVKFPWTEGEAEPPAGSRPRKGRRKEKARGIPPPPGDSAKSLPVIPTFRQRRPGQEMSRAAVRSTCNLVVTSPQTAEKRSPRAGSLSKRKRARKGGRKDERPVTRPEEAPQLALDFTENPSANPTSRRHPSKRIPQPAGDFTKHLRVSSPTTEESAPALWSLSKNRRARKSRRKEKALPDPGAPSETPAGPAQSRDIVPAVAIVKRQMSGRSAQRVKAASESGPLTSAAAAAAAAEPSGGVAGRSGPQKLGRNAASANARRGFATSEFPDLTSTPEERAEKRRAGAGGASAARLVSAVRRSMQRAQEQFARKKRRKAAGSIGPL